MRNITVAIALMAMAMVPCLVQADVPDGQIVNLKIHVADMATVSHDALQIDLPINQRDQFAACINEMYVKGNHDFDVYFGVTFEDGSWPQAGDPWSELYEGIEAHVIVDVNAALISAKWDYQSGSGHPNPWPSAYLLNKGVHYPVRLDDPTKVGENYVGDRAYMIIDGQMGDYCDERTLVYEYRYTDYSGYKEYTVPILYAIIANSQYGTSQAVSPEISQAMLDDFDLNFIYTIQTPNEDSD